MALIATAGFCFADLECAESESKPAKRAGVSFGDAEDLPSEQEADDQEDSGKPTKSPGKVCI
jgi:hypothetical protein